MDLAQILLLGYLMRTPEVAQGIPLVYLILAMAVGGLFVYFGFTSGFELGAFGRRTLARSGYFYNRVRNGGGVYPPATLSRRHGGLADGCRGQHRGFRCEQRPARMPRPKVTFVHLHAHLNQHEGFARDNTCPPPPNNRLALTYKKPRNEMQMLNY